MRLKNKHNNSRKQHQSKPGKAPTVTAMMDSLAASLGVTRDAVKVWRRRDDWPFAGGPWDPIAVRRWRDANVQEQQGGRERTKPLPALPATVKADPPLVVELFEEVRRLNLVIADLLANFRNPRGCWCDGDDHESCESLAAKLAEIRTLFGVAEVPGGKR